MIARKIAVALGNARREGRDWRCLCPVHGGSSLALRDGCRGLLVRCWAGCETRDVLTELRRRGLIASHNGDARPKSVVEHRDDRGDSARRRALAQRIWAAGRDARGTPVAQYLAGRDITIPVPPSLRWAPALRRPDGTHAPAMVARVDNVDGELIGVHRTWIVRGPDGIWRRRDRAMLGRAAGGAVRLGAARRDVPLVVAERIESCFGAMQATDLPGWAALSAIGIKRLILPTDLRDVLIAVDRDPNGTGERAARMAGRQWLTEGRRVRLLIPHVIGADAADRIGEARWPVPLTRSNFTGPGGEERSNWSLLVEQIVSARDRPAQSRASRPRSPSRPTPWRRSPPNRESAPIASDRVDDLWPKDRP